MSQYSVFVLAYARLKNISYLDARREDKFKILYDAYKSKNIDQLKDEDKTLLTEVNIIRNKIMEGK